MSNLILTVISIALMGALLLQSVNYINPIAQIAAKLEPQMINSFHTLESGYNAYVLAVGSNPTQLSDITPKYAFLPAAPKNTSWSFGTGGSNGTGQYFCLSGVFNPALMRASINLQGSLSPQAYFINSTCGVTTNAIPAGNNPTVALTYWVSTYQ